MHYMHIYYNPTPTVISTQNITRHKTHKTVGYSMYVQSPDENKSPGAAEVILGVSVIVSSVWRKGRVASHEEVHVVVVK